MECRICGSGRGRRFQAREMMFGLRHVFEYFECADCAGIQILAPPENLSDYYPPGYYSLGDGEAWSDDQPSRLARLKRRLRHTRNRSGVTGKGWIGRVILRLRPTPTLESLQALGLKTTDSILDVGSGSGSLVRDLRAIGFSDAIGVDPFVRGTVIDGGRPLVHKGTLEEMSGHWDVIMFHHSLEHIWDQRRTLERAASLLTEDGRILVRMPIVADAWTTYGPDWVQLDAPRHLTIHSIRSFRQLTEDVGLEIVRTVWDSTEIQFLASEQYRRDVPLLAPQSWVLNPSRSPFSGAQLKGFERKARALNRNGRGDQACFYLQVPGVRGSSER